jgi:hypothetical protein
MEGDDSRGIFDAEEAQADHAMPGMFDAEVAKADQANPELPSPPVELLESGEESDEAFLANNPKTQELPNKVKGYKKAVTKIQGNFVGNGLGSGQY